MPRSRCAVVPARTRIIARTSRTTVRRSDAKGAMIFLIEFKAFYRFSNSLASAPRSALRRIDNGPQCGPFKTFRRVGILAHHRILAELALKRWANTPTLHRAILVPPVRAPAALHAIIQRCPKAGRL